MGKALKKDLVAAKRFVGNTAYVNWVHMDERYAQARFGSKYDKIWMHAIVMQIDRVPSMTGTTNIYKITVKVEGFVSPAGERYLRLKRFSPQLLKLVSPADNNDSEHELSVISGVPHDFLIREQQRAERAATDPAIYPSLV
ncbi:hypothetical protein SARC_03293 [Sphaeroforma arctica JP610]|uniref:Uncharacterized protein n=1 Tax=Sphaeroforma arctica JP610 TaxID=667725 RepID=A0A0L0G8B6_9EUKA|nr:hypothetical protein SARC_03293 [Sphaeroforma arctica JP610]KNC84488.1 hypothetical protein SARC_03293 [Sphaeroforma arctica JP610]|eukprot:XP_014158390.1 hypothetical protein SARC_03293 [Sphaeroforma arctica JP610]